jgi:CBS domain containing-hemolysin-like protein
LESHGYWLATGAAFIVSVFCSVAEGALLSYSPSRLDKRLRDPHRRQRVESYLANVDRYLYAAVVINAISDVVLVFACTLAFLDGGPWRALALSLAVVILGAEVLPRAFAAFYAEPLLPKVLPTIAAIDMALLPIMWPLHKLREAIARAIAGDEKERRAAEIVDEIRSATLEGSREGILAREEAEMIESVIEFHDVEVREVMTPRPDMIMIEVSSKLEDAIKVAVEKGHSRIPVYEGTRDRIIGVLYARDLLKLYGDGKTPKDDVSLRSILRKPLYVPVTKQIGELLKEFRTRKVHIAIVLDEYGGTAGMVTIEDVIEEIIGEIEDEYEVATEAPPPLKRIDAATVEVDARMKIGELNDELGLDLPEDGEFETLGGFIFYQLGKVPKKGEKLARGDAEFTVLEADERRIRRVRVQVKKTQPAT